MRPPQKVPEASACKGVDCPSHCALYHRLISEGNICVWIHETYVSATEQQVRDAGKSRALKYINVAAAVSAHLCNSQIMSSLRKENIPDVSYGLFQITFTVAM